MGDPIHPILRLSTRVYGSLRVPDHSCTRRSAAGRRTRCGTRTSEQRDELALGLGIALDVALRHGQAGMARELLHVPETPPDLGDSARRTRNKGAASRVRRTAVHLE